MSEIAIFVSGKSNGSQKPYKADSTVFQPDLKELQEYLSSGWKVKKISSQNVDAPSGTSFVRYGGWLIILEK